MMTIYRYMHIADNPETAYIFLLVSNTVQSPLRDCSIRHKNVVSQDRLFLVTGSVILKCRNFSQEYLVFQDRWFLMAVVSQDRCHCNPKGSFISRTIVHNFIHIPCLYY